MNQEEEITPKNVIDLVIKECKRVISGISKKHEIDYDELLNEHLPEKIRLHNLLIKRKNRRNLPMTEMCMGRKLDMQQCTRRRQDNYEYCASHTKKLKMGRIDEPFPSELLKGKRGRRKKQLVNVEHQNCIPTYLEVINRQKFLIDDYGRVYYYNEANPQDTCYIGVQTLSGDITYDENYLKLYSEKYPIISIPDDFIMDSIKTSQNLLPCAKKIPTILDVINDCHQESSSQPINNQLIRTNTKITPEQKKSKANSFISKMKLQHKIIT